jgi:hypothetical protein
MKFPVQRTFTYRRRTKYYQNKKRTPEKGKEYVLFGNEKKNSEPKKIKPSMDS